MLRERRGGGAEEIVVRSVNEQRGCGGKKRKADLGVLDGELSNLGVEEVGEHGDDSVALWDG